jgi:hypothetical protein
MATAGWGGTMRAASGRLLVCVKSGVLRDPAAAGPLPVAPDAERKTRNVVCSCLFPPAFPLFIGVITDYRLPFTDYLEGS